MYYTFHLRDRVEVTDGPFAKWQGTVLAVCCSVKWCSVKLDGLNHDMIFYWKDLRCLERQR